MSRNSEKPDALFPLPGPLKPIGAEPSSGRGETNPKKSVKPGSRYINRRALLILVGIVIALPLLYYGVRFLQDNALRRSALVQARETFDNGDHTKAFTILDNYLDHWPDDLKGLELVGELIAKSPAGSNDVMKGIDAIDKLLRLDPDAPERQEDRKRLVLLSIRLGDIVRVVSDRRKSGLAKTEGRYQYANNIAEQRMKLGADDGESHRILAMTLERLAIDGDVEFEARAVKEYQKALRKDPGDFYAAERLAAIRMDRKADLGKTELPGAKQAAIHAADQILDTLVKARPRAVEARIIRARHYLKTNREDRARIDLEAATKLDANNQGIRLMAASLALRRGDAASAKRYLAAVPENGRLPEYDMLLAQVDFLERRPDQALEKLRKGLARTSGTDVALTFQLAYTLIRSGRSVEARPLLEQYQRLTGRKESPMIHFLEGVSKERSGRFSSALVEFQAAREEIQPEWKGENELAIGRCAEAIGDIETAKAAYLNARVLMESSPYPRQSLARLLVRTAPDQAVAELEQAVRLALGQSSPSLLADLANARINLQLTLPADRRDWSLAEAAIEQGLRARPDDPSLHLARARLLTSIGKPDEAEAKLAEATKGVARRSEELWLARSQQLENRGRFDDALQVLEQASESNAAGDRATLRVARAKLLAKGGRGRAALDLVTSRNENFTPPDRAILARSRAELLLALGDRPGATATIGEWAALTPDDPTPGLMLLEISRRGGTTEEMDQAFELIQKAGGDDEPSLIAARAIAMLLPRVSQDEIDATRLDEAESLSLSLQELAPKMPASAVIRGLIAEQSGEIEEAVTAYKDSIKTDTTGLALPRLVGLLTRFKRTDELTKLRAEASSPSAIDKLTVRETLEAGDKDQAEALLTKLVAAQPDSLEYTADLARVLREMGKPEQAEAAVLALVKRRPNQPQPWLALLALQLERGDNVAAAATVDLLKTSYKGDRPNLLLARCLWIVGKRDEAASVSTAELARQPQDLEALRLASEIDESIGRNDRAEQLIARARAINPNLTWARRRLALILSARNNASRWPEARALVAAAPSAKGEAPEDRFIRAIVLERGPDSVAKAEAISTFRSLIEDLPLWNPVASRGRLRLAEIQIQAKDLEGAVQTLTPMIADNAAPDPTALALAIEARALDGKVDEARQWLDLLTKAQPNSPLTTVCRAIVIKAEGDPKTAASTILEAAATAEKSADGERLNRFYFDQLAAIGPDEAIEQLARKIADRWPAQGVTLARYLSSKGKVDEAFQVCQSAARTGQIKEPLVFLLALDAEGKLDESRIEKVKELAISAAIQAPKGLDLLSIAATFLRRHGRFQDEAALYRKLLEIDSSNYAARNNLAWVLGHDLGKLDEALVEVERVISQVGMVHQALDTRGMILAKLGRIKEAVADFERSAKMAPTAVHQIHLARAYALAGRSDDRRRILETARLAVTNPSVLDPEDLAELNSLDE